MTAFLATTLTIFRKEMREHFRTRRLLVIGAVFAFVFIALSLYGGIISGQGGSEPSYRAGANAVLGMVLSFTGIFPGLLAIVISYTAIAGERSRKSLILLLSKPVRRSAVFLGKFLSSYLAIALVYVTVMTAGYISVAGASGKPPSAEEVARAYGALCFVLMAVACWVAFTMLLSSLLKSPLTVVVSAILVWFLVMPIVSSIGMIYWIVSTSSEEGGPNGVSAALLVTPGEGATMILAAEPSTVFSVRSESAELAGRTIGGYYTLSNVPEGSYSWSARGGGIDRNGTISVGPYGGFTVEYSHGSELRVSAAESASVVLVRDGEPVPPAEKKEEGGMVNYTFSGNLGECFLSITANGQVLFTGGYELARYSGAPFAGALEGEMPEYVKYNQLINPDIAMTGYEQVLEPSRSSPAGVSPAEGAGALAAFFAVFLTLGLLVFTRKEMT